MKRTLLLLLPNTAEAAAGLILLLGLLLFLGAPGHVYAAGPNAMQRSMGASEGAPPPVAPVATPGLRYVAPDGGDAGTCDVPAQPCRSIGYALNQAAAGDELRVAAGIYKELIQVTKAITLTGGFTVTNWNTPAWTANRTILDGQDAYRPLTISADGVRVDGFVVRNGNTSGGDRMGGGIFVGPVNTVDRATLVNLRLENNVASNFDSGEGGGLMATMGNTFQLPAQLVLSNVTVVDNTATTGSQGATGGGMHIQAVGNSPLNVQMFNVTVQGNIAGNDFSSMGGGMALQLNGGTATLRRVRILDNYAARLGATLGGPSQGGGIYLSNGNLLLENVVIAGNVARRGDALAVQNSNALTTTVNMNYVTLVGGTPRVGGAVASVVRASGTWTNFILLNTLIGGGPVAFEAQNYAQDSTLDYYNVLIDDNVSTTITGTISANGTPLRGAAGFANVATGDYRLTAASSAVDRGSILPPLFDLDGMTRPKGVTSDIGAYEFAPPGLADQAIAFAPLPDKLVADLPFTVSATASSGLTVSLVALTPGVCSMNGGQVTLLTTGTCLMQAGQAGDAAFNPAPPVMQAFAVKSPEKAGQSITFAPLADKTLGDLPFALRASASSGLPVSFLGATPSVCLVDGATLTLVAAGVCGIIAMQEGNATLNPATPVVQRFTVRRQDEGAARQVFLPEVVR